MSRGCEPPRRLSLSGWVREHHGEYRTSTEPVMSHVTCHDYCYECDLLCDNPGVSMTSHVQSRSLLEYSVSILFAENKVLRQFLTKRVFLFTLHIKNTLWLDKTWDFRESLCRISGPAQTPQLSQPFQTHFLSIHNYNGFNQTYFNFVVIHLQVLSFGLKPT